MAACLNIRLFTTAVICTLAVAGTGCMTANHTERGALVGAGLGAGAGAILGDRHGDAGSGAVLGGTLGALTGALMGNAEDAWEQRDAAMAELAASSRPMHPPLTNVDLVRMTQAGLGDEVVINAVQSRGGQFDLSPDGLIALKSSGVSERVIGHVQTVGSTPVPTQQIREASAVVAPPPGIVIVRPQPVVGVHLGVGHPHRHQRRRPRSGFAFSWHKHF